MLSLRMGLVAFNDDGLFLNADVLECLRGVFDHVFGPQMKKIPSFVGRCCSKNGRRILPVVPPQDSSVRVEM